MAGWLVAAAWISLAFAAVPATVVAAYIASGRRQRMWIMNVVWPVTVLYAGPLGLWAFLALDQRRGGQ